MSWLSRWILLNAIKSTYDTFIFGQLGELLLGRVGVCQQDFDDGLGEAFHVPLPDFRIGAFELGDDVKALCQLRENVNDRSREEGVLAASLELLFDTKHPEGGI
jgi:hypothetical protein